MDYAHKSRSLPRFVYRNFIDRLNTAGSDRAAEIDNFVNALTALKPREDWLKMKWVMPPRLAAQLAPAELAVIERTLVARRDRRNDRFLEVYPHCSDEFSLDLPFLEAAFGSSRQPLITPTTRVLTMGSCFARNIANFLGGKGYSVLAHQQAEDLNSPFSNAKMLSICAADEPMRRAYISHWVKVMYPPDAADKYDEIISGELKRLDSLASAISGCELLIITCGNIIDYFLPACPIPGEPGPSVAPKFFTVSSSENVELRHYLTQRMREAGANFRMGDYAESLEALKSQHAALRRINPNAHVIYTLSPVPIDSAISLQQSERRGAVELDCISKSTLRAALGDFLNHHSNQERVSYFPSFEIVRWIAPVTGVPLFGNEDAASRHVSQDVLNGVYRYFLHRHGS